MFIVFLVVARETQAKPPPVLCVFAAFSLLFRFHCIHLLKHTPDTSVYSCTWRCRGCFHLGTLAAWCSPWLCRGWRSVSSGQRTHQEPRSSLPVGSQTSGSGCYEMGRPSARLSSSDAGTGSWWNPTWQKGLYLIILDNTCGCVGIRIHINSHHVDFGDAVDALHLHINAYGNGRTYKKNSLDWWHRYSIIIIIIIMKQ